MAEIQRAWDVPRWLWYVELILCMRWWLRFEDHVLSFSAAWLCTLQVWRCWDFQHSAARGTWPPYRSPRESVEATSADARDVMDDFTSSAHAGRHATSTYLQPKLETDKMKLLRPKRSIELSLRRSCFNEIKTILSTIFETWFRSKDIMSNTAQLSQPVFLGSLSDSPGQVNPWTPHFSGRRKMPHESIPSWGHGYPQRHLRRAGD